MGKEFNNALGNFINDFAAGGAVRHYVDLGYTVDEIAGRLDYPLPKDKVAEIVFQYYIDRGDISLAEPREEVEKARFVKEYNSLGKTSLRKVVDTVQIDCKNYLKCDFGRQIYKSKDKKIIDNGILSQRMLDHINTLPWPLQDVWVNKDLFKEV